MSYQGKKNQYELTTDNLRWVLQSNPSAVSFPALVSAFGLNKETQGDLERGLDALIESGDAKKDRDNRYMATQPISDIVLARVGASTGKKRELKIQNLSKDKPEFPVYLSNKLIRKFENKEGRKLRKGEIVAVVLERNGGVELQARNLIGVVKSNKKLLVTAQFEGAAAADAGARLSVLHPNSRTAFLAASIDHRSTNPENLHGQLRASISKDFDPENPSLHVESKRWEPKTGMPVAMIVAHKNGIPLRHSAEAEFEARQMTAENFLADRHRHDFRNLRIMVIDPANAHDHDDGIYVEHSNEIINGQRAAYRSLVVVPDIPFYVRPGSKLDTEARDRGFSNYFGSDALHLYPDMMPCRKVSLRSGKLRPVIFVEKYWDENAEALAPAEIGTAIIENQRVLSYGQFQNLCDSNDPEVWNYIGLGDHLINKSRMERGVVIDSAGHNLQASYAQAFVAAFMQDANEEIANFLHENNVPFLRRAHGPKMNDLAYAECKQYLSVLGYDLPDDVEDLTVAEVQSLLFEADNRGERTHVEEYVRQYFLHLAEYTTADKGHFGLNLQRYGHFTSPIRRYADTLGLRGVHTALGNDELGLSDDDINRMGETAEYLNWQQQVAKNTALDFMRFNAVSRLAQHEGFQRSAQFSGVTYPFVNIDLRLPKSGALRKKIHFQDLPEHWSIAPDRKGMVFNGEAGPQYVRPGDVVKMVIREVFPEKGEWDFENLHPKMRKQRPEPGWERHFAAG